MKVCQSGVLEEAVYKLVLMVVYTLFFLPVNIKSLIKPLDPRVIMPCKRLYYRKYLDDVLIDLEEDEDLMQYIRRL